MSCPQPTAQYGQTPANAFASLILSDTAAASTGSMSTPAPSAAPVAVAPPYFRKSRRERLIEASLSPLWTRELVPDTTDDDDPRGAAHRPLELDDVARVQRGEVRATPLVVTDDEGLLGAREVGAGVGDAPDPDGVSDGIDGDDDVAVLLHRVGEAHGALPSPLSSALWPALRLGRILGGPTPNVKIALLRIPLFL